ncbi:MAG: hypothetical protein WCO25_03060 [Candidatus Uhrbacteria bacterium]
MGTVETQEGMGLAASDRKSAGEFSQDVLAILETRGIGEMSPDVSEKFLAIREFAKGEFRRMVADRKSERPYEKKGDEEYQNPRNRVGERLYLALMTEQMAKAAEQWQADEADAEKIKDPKDRALRQEMLQKTYLDGSWQGGIKPFNQVFLEGSQLGNLDYISGKRYGADAVRAYVNGSLYQRMMTSRGEYSGGLERYVAARSYAPKAGTASSETFRPGDMIRNGLAPKKVERVLREDWKWLGPVMNELSGIDGVRDLQDPNVVKFFNELGVAFDKGTFHFSGESDEERAEMNETYRKGVAEGEQWKKMESDRAAREAAQEAFRVTHREWVSAKTAIETARKDQSRLGRNVARLDGARQTLQAAADALRAREQAIRSQIEGRTADKTRMQSEWFAWRHAAFIEQIDDLNAADERTIKKERPELEQADRLAEDASAKHQDAVRELERATSELKALEEKLQPEPTA